MRAVAWRVYAPTPWTPGPVTRLDGLPNRPEDNEHQPNERDWKEDHTLRLTPEIPSWTQGYPMRLAPGL